MPQAVAHAGGCCGMRSVFGFGRGAPDADSLAQLDQIIRDYQTGNQNNTRYPNNRLLEVVLTDRQCEAGWPAELRRRGFKRMARWLNSNSGNVCNLFLLFHESDAPAPYPWPALPQEHRGRYRQRARRA